MSERLRWGILGTGLIARMFTTDLQLAGFTVTAVGSRSQEGADAFAAEFGLPRAHASYEALAADPEVDVIYVATPHPFHAENALLALEHGKHVLVEKPFTLNADEARRVVELGASKGLVVLEAMWTRWLPHMVRIREIMASGTLGEVRAVIADHDQKLPLDPEHRLQNPALGGGALLDLGIYPVSFAWDVFGAPSTVHAISSPTATGVDRQTAIILGFPGGEQAVLHTQLDARGPSTAVVIGTEARIEIDPVWYNATSFTVIDPQENVVERYDEKVPGRGMQFQAAELERLVAAGVTAGDILPPDETVGIMGTLDEVRRQIGLRYPGE
ncbi:Gfo/Idh/MocA family oxidoreductase [Protaetiibacter sp. SSC-01]|uniref:Gfo/Idh/MocA family protein n=1 Tax=Protaetiibacter sp. SSC-01 TaxID=2759943 RepID=UPI00165717A0|nr:Gfo/Idh/MocA family oxidoreductase [Protaetiibacter sp. SSC-01]QNO37102.1 Gfo/Idh/MocA family oxidoreductase [Protaetiibacter sp. SSC-01]